ncbi:MAG: LysE family transporter [Chloroflexi bacterium]|nr:LysE family transporter [Chloroflexota bacterium]
MNLQLLADGALLSLSLCLDLGIVNLAIIRTGIVRGAVPAFLIGLGSCFGDIIWAGLAGAGIAALLQFTIVRWVLWLGGTAALLYLTWQMVRQAIAAPTPEPTPVGPATGDREAASPSRDGRIGRVLALVGPSTGIGRDFLDGLLLALASPTAIVWFAAVGGSLIASSVGTATTLDLASFYTGFFLAGLGWSLVVAIGATVLGRALGPALVRMTAIASAALFVYFAWRVFMSGIETLI